MQCSAAAGAVQVGEALLAAGLDHCASVDPHCPRDTPNTTIATAPGLQNPFLYPREMDGLQTALSGLPTAGVYVVGAALTAGMGAVGFTAAQALAPGASVAVVVAAGECLIVWLLLPAIPPSLIPSPLSPCTCCSPHPAEGLRAAAKYVAAAAGAALGAWAAVQLRDRRQAGAIVELANLLVSLGDPTLLTRDMVGAPAAATPQPPPPRRLCTASLCRRPACLEALPVRMPHSWRSPAHPHLRPASGPAPPALSSPSPQVTAIESKYGLLLTDAACLPDTQAIYGTFVEAAIPPGDAPMSGAEPQLIQGFKDVLGLSDVDAAPVHLDVGRRILRGRMEAGTRGEDIEVRRRRRGGGSAHCPDAAAVAAGSRGRGCRVDGIGCLL